MANSEIKLPISILAQYALGSTGLIIDLVYYSNFDL